MYFGCVKKAEVEAPAEVLTAAARVFRVLADPTRLGILELLLERPHIVSELVHELGMSQSRLSNHLACLRWCGFVQHERQGRCVVYRIADAGVGEVIAAGKVMASAHATHLASCERIGPDWI